MKKELFLPLIIFALTLVFAVICLMVYLSKGNAYWIKRKLKIGALLLTFNGIVYGVSGQPAPTCYLGPPDLSQHLYGIIMSAEFITHHNPELNATSVDQITLPTTKGDGFLIGFSYEYLFGHPFDSRSSIICNIHYNEKYANSAKQLNPNAIIDTNLLTINEFSKIKFDYQFKYLNIDVLYKHSIWIITPLQIIIGPSLATPIKLLAKEEITTPLKNDNFDNKHDVINVSNEESKIIYNDKIRESQIIDLGIKLGLQFEIVLNDQLHITAFTNYRYPLTLIQNGTNWKVTSFDSGLSVRYGFDKD